MKRSTDRDNPVTTASARAMPLPRLPTYLRWQGELFLPRDPASFDYTQGTPTQFTRPDLENAVTRDFRARCGTHILTRRPGLKELVLKVGTLDDSKGFIGPQMTIFTEDMQPFHQIPPRS